MDLSFLSQAEAVMFEMEKARRNLETAKANFENAKKDYDELLSKSDEFGVPKAKLKKLIEDRIAMLFDSGILDFIEVPGGSPAIKKPKKPKRAKTQATDSEEFSESVTEPQPEAESEDKD